MTIQNGIFITLIRMNGAAVVITAIVFIIIIIFITPTHTHTHTHHWTQCIEAGSSSLIHIWLN
ncbi:hypothetical protein EXN66_Car021022 [Channa argus]|uniref:Uncharacterized protein n=1 Tax=Channa argus TaxID=215402 RepID=A0A6G1QRL6_CHAAH|nr:hypothetical protein EXN66_Car021022 [Channa argus]